MNSTKKIIVLYLLLVPLFFGIDLLWLGLVASEFYSDQIGFLLVEKVNWVAALVFYLLYIASIIYFAVLPGVEKISGAKSAINGALLGFIAYATYDLTNLATLKGWPLNIVLVDMLWGTLLTMIVAVVGWYIAARLLSFNP